MSVFKNFMRELKLMREVVNAILPLSLSQVLIQHLNLINYYFLGVPAFSKSSIDNLSIPEISFGDSLTDS